jgi:hypothetical protein
MALVDAPNPFAPRIFVRGSPSNPGEAVPRQLPEIVARGSGSKTVLGSGRLELARAITDRNNPLTARVFVNRVWAQLFGRGLVATPGDFGVRTDPPSHPELLDQLASNFIRDGWSFKKLLRRIVLSATYRQTALRDVPSDPENLLYTRMNRKRLDVEPLRDSLLSAAGRLDRQIGGPSIKDMHTTSRRTLYTFLDRLHVPPLLSTFDFPNPDTSSPARTTTTVPQQALFLMNHVFVEDCARRLAQQASSMASLEERVTKIYDLTLGRLPLANELELARGFLGRDDSPGRWQSYCQALLMSNELCFVD